MWHTESYITKHVKAHRLLTEIRQDKGRTCFANLLRTIQVTINKKIWLKKATVNFQAYLALNEPPNVSWLRIIAKNIPAKINSFPNAS